MSDLINRQQVIDVLEEQLDYLFTLNKKDNPTAKSKWYGINWARNTIAKLPSAEPKVGEWIPCEERLPQEYGKYLTTIGSLLEEYSNGIDIIYYGKFTTSDDKEKVGWHYVDEWGEWEATHVIAWQPLLEPYEMERSE